MGDFFNIFVMILKDFDGSGYYNVYLDGGSNVLIENGDVLFVSYDFNCLYYFKRKQ